MGRKSVVGKREKNDSCGLWLFQCFGSGDAVVYPFGSGDTVDAEVYPRWDKIELKNTNANARIQLKVWFRTILQKKKLKSTSSRFECSL